MLLFQLQLLAHVFHLAGSPPSPAAHQPTTIADIHLSPPCASHFLRMFPLFHHFSCLYKGNILLQLKSIQSQPSQNKTRAFNPSFKPSPETLITQFQKPAIPWQITELRQSTPIQPANQQSHQSPQITATITASPNLRRIT